MNIHCEVRSYANAADMRASYAEIRRRLAAVPTPDEPMHAVEAEPEPEATSPYLLVALLLTATKAYGEAVPPAVHTVHRIKQAVCLEFKVRRVDIDSTRRDNDIVTPRHIAMALCKHLTNQSLPAVGRLFGGRDHTTVLHAVQKMRPAIEAVAPTMAPDATAAEWVTAMRAAVEGVG